MNILGLTSLGEYEYKYIWIPFVDKHEYEYKYIRIYQKCVNMNTNMIIWTDNHKHDYKYHTQIKINKYVYGYKSVRVCKLMHI